MSTQTRAGDGTGVPTEIEIDDVGDITLPVEDILTGRGFITGKSGSGKSNSASVVIEELLDAGLTLAVIDTDGEYYGLKERYELLHVGAGDAVDLQVGPEHADKLASLALDDGVPIILDVSDFSDEGGAGPSANTARELVREFAGALFEREKDARQPFPLFVEEVHEYVPEGGGLDRLGQLLIQIGKRGRKRGLGLVGLSQRPADVKKDFITQCDWLVWHRLTWSNDTKVAGRVLGSEFRDPIEELADGEGFIMADWNSEIRRVQFRRKHTFDAGATPGLGDVERPELKSVSEGLVGELEEISSQEARRQDEVERLEAVIDEKDDRIDELEQQLQQAQDVGNAAQQFVDALRGGVDADDEPAAVPEDFDAQLTAKNERIAELEDVVDERDERIATLNEQLETAQTKADRVEQLEARVEAAEETERRLEYVRGVLEGDVDVGEQLVVEETDGAAAGEVETLRERVDELETENERLESALEDADSGVSVPTDYQSFVDEPAVQEAIADAKENAKHVSPRYVKGVVAAILQEGGEVDYEMIAELLGVSGTSNVGKAATALESRGIVEKVSQRPVSVDFDIESVAEIKRKNQRREQAQAAMDDL